MEQLPGAVTELPDVREQPCIAVRSRCVCAITPIGKRRLAFEVLQFICLFVPLSRVGRRGLHFGNDWPVLGQFCVEP